MYVQTETSTSHSSCELTNVVPAVSDEQVQHTRCASEVAFQTDEAVNRDKLLSRLQSVHDELDSKSSL